MTDPISDPMQDVWATLHDLEIETDPMAAVPPFQTIIDVYVLTRQASESDSEAGDPAATVESNLTSAEPQTEEPGSTPTTLPPSTRPVAKASEKRLFLPVCLLLGACILIGAGLLPLLPLLASSAMVTLLPLSRQLRADTTLSLQTEAAPLRAQAVAGRLLPTLTLSRQARVPTTGSRFQQAQAAHGTITFYNAAPMTQTIAAGTLLTGTEGVQVVTEQDAIIPAAVFPTDGQTSVVAQAVQSGPPGNIRAGDIYGACCRENVFVRNSAFSGGQDARTLRMVSQHDLDMAAASLKSSLQASIQAALQAEVQSGEILLTPVACIPTLTASPTVGQEASQVRVTLDDICTGETYRMQVIQTHILPLLTQQARRSFGTRYLLTGAVQIKVSASGGRESREPALSLNVTATSTWVYRFSQIVLEQFRALIVGKPLVQAKHLLLRQPGVSNVSLRITGRDTTMLPDDANAIQVVVMYL